MLKAFLDAPADKWADASYEVRTAKCADRRRARSTARSAKTDRPDTHCTDIPGRLRKVTLDSRGFSLSEN